jgi:hypothetical protein
MLMALAHRVRPRVGVRRAFNPTPPDPPRGGYFFAKGNDMAAKKKTAKKAAKKPAKKKAAKKR